MTSKNDKFNILKVIELILAQLCLMTSKQHPERHAVNDLSCIPTDKADTDN